MQKSPTAFPIGYFAGSTERGDYDTLCEAIGKQEDNRVELSFQTVYQQGVSAHVWNIATDRATKVFEDPNSKAHRQLKFSLAPSALTVFVSEEEEIEPMRSIFISKYGNLTSKSWPVMHDGSRLRFVPILQGYINDERMKNQLQEQLTIQALAKGGEIKFDFNLIDIKEKKHYLNNNSMEQIIHSIPSKDNKNVPVFKHITKKWMRKGEPQMYEIAVDPRFEEEAREQLKGLRQYLLEKYGPEVRNHFHDYKGSQYPGNGDKKRNYSTQKAICDEATMNFIMNMNHDNHNAKCLIEGIELVD